MGALHGGHYEGLIPAARARAERVCVSIFVNPSQFGPGEDFERYPRSLQDDLAGCEARGVDVVFAPAADAIYPPGFQTYVSVEELTEPLCGRSRPGHFRGVTTVVLKLLMLAQPTVAVFGWKDAQQLLAVRRMVEDLNVPTEIVGVETVREPDGLAISSRNQYLTPEQRAAAPRIHQGLREAAEAFASGERDVETLLGLARRRIASSGLPRIDYLEARSLKTLAPLAEAEPGNTLIAAAVYLGKARLIDNIRL